MNSSDASILSARDASISDLVWFTSMDLDNANRFAGWCSAVTSQTEKVSEVISSFRESRAKAKTSEERGPV